MVPLLILEKVLDVALEFLRAYNHTDDAQRREIIQRLLDDDAARRKWLTDAGRWFETLFKGVKW